MIASSIRAAQTILEVFDLADQVGVTNSIEFGAYKTNKRSIASSPAVLERSLVPFPPQSLRNLLQMTAHCPEDSGSLPVFPPMPVFRPVDTLGNCSCVQD